MSPKSSKVVCFPHLKVGLYISKKKIFLLNFRRGLKSDIWCITFQLWRIRTWVPSFEPFSEKFFHPWSQCLRNVNVSAHHGHQDLLSPLMTMHTATPLPVLVLVWEASAASLCNAILHVITPCCNSTLRFVNEDGQGQHQSACLKLLLLLRVIASDMELNRTWESTLRNNRSSN